MNKKTIYIITAILLTICITFLSVYLDTKGGAVADYLEITLTPLDTGYQTTVDKTSEYLAHPDMVMTDSGRLLAAYPAGHGYGQILLKYSDDLGATWGERLSGTPSSWADSQETPTLYKLNFTDGRTKIILVSGCPYWTKAGLKANGFNYSESNDDGESWSEFQNFHSPYDCIVAMSSLTQLKENGEYVDKWMGTFHTHRFINYKTILSFDETGNAVWSEPTPLLKEHRGVERRAKLCEIEIIRGRGDNEGTLVMLCRAQARKTRSMISVSRDEGATWTEPVELPYVLSGDRHKAEYDAVSGLYLISFRQIIPARENAFAKGKFMTQGWVGWVGTFEDLLAMQNGESVYGKDLLLLGYDYTEGGDCGYSGTVCVDGTMVCISYGYFKADLKNPYIMCVRFRLSDFY